MKFKKSKIIYSKTKLLFSWSQDSPITKIHQSVPHILCERISIHVCTLVKYQYMAYFYTIRVVIGPAILYDINHYELMSTGMKATTLWFNPNPTSCL